MFFVRHAASLSALIEQNKNKGKADFMCVRFVNKSFQKVFYGRDFSKNPFQKVLCARGCARFFNKNFVYVGCCTTIWKLMNSFVYSIENNPIDKSAFELYS